MKPVLPLVALALLGACSQSPEAANTSTTNEAVVAPVEAPKSPAKAYADMTAGADTFEKAAGNLAKEKGSTKAVRDFGKLVYDEHVGFTMDLKLAAAKVPGLLPDPTMTPAQTADLEALKAANGPAFDRLFLSLMRAHHTAMLPRQEAFAASGEDAALTDFAERYARWVQRHIRLSPAG